MLESLEDSSRKPAAAWLGSILAHVAVLAALAVVSIPEARNAVRQRWTPLFAPPVELPVKMRQQAPKVVLPMPSRVVPPNAMLLPAVPGPVFRAPTAARSETIPDAAAPATKLPPMAVRMELPREAAPAPAVRTGGFGSFGEPASRAAAAHPPAVHLPVGEFEGQRAGVGVPAGKEKAVAAAGFGDAGGAGATTPRGTKGAASAGFGGGSAGSAPAPARPKVSGMGFDEAVKAPAVKSGEGTGKGAAASGAATRLEILDKPRPRYTDEARRLRIEGEVVIQAVFEASGGIRVLRIVEGLGHGLDENAATAARAIRFRPATQGGQAVDTIAVVRIQFQLAF